MNNDIIDAFVVWGRKMSAYCGVRFPGVVYAEKVAFKPLFDFLLGLSDILFETCFAADAIYEIIAVASDVLFSNVFFASGGTDDMSRFV